MEPENEQPDQQKTLSQPFSQQHEKSSLQWHSVGRLGQKVKRRDDLLQKTKLVKGSWELQKSEVRGALESTPLSKSEELSQPLASSAVPTASLEPSYNNMTPSVVLGHEREKRSRLATVSTSVTRVNSSKLDSQNQEVWPSMSFDRHRSNSLSEIPIAIGVASVGSITDSLTPSNINSPATRTAPMPSLVAKADQPVVALSQNKDVETISKLVSLFQHSMELDNDQQPEQLDQQQMPSQCFSQQQDGNPALQWHSLGQIGQKDKKRDDLLQKIKSVQSTREFEKPEVRGPLQSTSLSTSGDLSQPLASAAVPTASLGPSNNNMTVPVVLGQQREKPVGLATVTTETGVNSTQLNSQNEQVQPSTLFGWHRSNSLPEILIANGVASAGCITDLVTPLNINCPSAGTAGTVDQPVASLSQNNHVETISKLVSMFQHTMELDNHQQPEQPDQQQIPSCCFSQQQDGKLSFQWHSVGQLGRNDNKRDDILQKTKLVQISRELQKPEVTGASQSSPLSNSGELSQPITSAAVLTGSFGPSYNKMTAHVALGRHGEEPRAMATVSTLVTGVNSSQHDSQNEQVQSSMSFERRRSKYLPEMFTISGVSSPGNIVDSMTSLNVNSPSTGTASMHNFAGKTDQSVAALGQNKHLETISKLVSVLQRHGLHTRKRKIIELPEVKKQAHYWPLHLIALASDANDRQDIKGQRSVTDSVTPSNANSSSSRTAPMHRLVAKTDQVAAALGQNMHLETISKLVSMFQRHGLHTKKRKIDEFPEVKKQLPYRPLQLIALPSDVNNEDQQDVQRSMASSLVQGGVKVCKSRIINFERTDFLPQGSSECLRRDPVVQLAGKKFFRRKWSSNIVILPKHSVLPDLRVIHCGMFCQFKILLLLSITPWVLKLLRWARWATAFLYSSTAGTPVMLHINRIRLVMCERAKDGMVDAVVQYLSNSIPQDDLVSLPNTHYADILAMQFCALMVKDGYKLTEDQIQPIQSQPKFSPPPAPAV